MRLSVYGSGIGRDRDQGFMMIELMLVIVLLALFGLTLLRANMMTLQSRGTAELQSLAAQIGAESMEEYAGIDPINLDNADDRDDTVTRKNHQFARSINVTVNSDQSRTVSVDITSLNPRFRASVNYSSRFAMWGSL